MKKHLVFCALICLAAWVWAGNRADVNADQSVDAADMTVLANLLTGNLDIAGYDLANVVVVAPQGGDFTNPADAADWVATQSPSSSNRFLIWVTPGEYSSGGTVYLPSYTTMRGADRRNCRLVQSSGTGIACNSVSEVAIADLQVYARTGVQVHTGASVVIRNVLIDSYYNSTSFWARCLNVIDSTGVTVEDCELNSTGGSSALNDAYLVFNSNSEVSMRGCTGSVSHARSISRAICLYVYDPGGTTSPVFQVENCRLEAEAVTVGYANYLYKDTPAVGWTRLFNCILRGTNTTTTQLVRWNCCDPDGVATP